MKTILSYPLSILYYLCFGILLFSFQIIQWFCLNMFGYYAHKKSVDILNFLILLSLSIIKAQIFFEAESNLPPPGKNVIFIANHQSTYDIPPLIWYLRRYSPKFVAKKELGKGLPSISFHLREGGNVLIDRKNSSASLEAIATFAKRVDENNWSVIIFPEGTRTRNGQPKTFQRGGLTTLLNHLPQALLVPVSISHSWKLAQWNYFPMPLGVHVKMKIQKPIDPKVYTQEEALALLEKTVKKEIKN